MKFSWTHFYLLVGVLLSTFAVEAQTLQVALDAPNLTWTTSGTGTASGWSEELAVTHDGMSAAVCGTHSSTSGIIQTSTLQTTVTGPGTLTFWWYGSAADLDGSQLSFLAGSATLATIATGVPWMQQTIYLGAGSQTLKWVYTLPAFAPNGNPGFVDQVVWTPGATAPLIMAQPFSQSIVRGLNAAFSVSAGGTPPLSYQWQFNGNSILNATSNSLVITNVQAANLGNYHVVVSNGQGARTSTDASLAFGEVAVWGYNPSGDNRGSAPPGATGVRQISGGYSHNLLLKTNGVVLAWGSTNVAQAVLAGNPSNSLAVAALSGSGVVLNADETVSAWGTSSITNVPPNLSGVVAIASGPTATYCLALKSDGTVIGWGNSPLGQTTIPPAATNIVSLAAGEFHCLALRADGRIVSWGDNSSGQRNAPTAQLYSATNKVVAIAAGGYHSLALRSDGTVFAWGLNSSGQTNVPTSAKGVVAIAAGFNHSLALRTNGTVLAWGYNSDGQINVPANLTNVVAVSAGAFHSLALVGSGQRATASVGNAVFSSGAFQLSIPSQSGRIFELDYKNSIRDANWTALPFVAGNGTNVVLIDPAATNSQRFYRVVRW